MPKKKPPVRPSPTAPEHSKLREKRRRKAIALLQAGNSWREVQVLVGVSRESISRWVARWKEEGAAGLKDKDTPRGRSLSIDIETARKIVERAKGDDGSWSLADAQRAAKALRVKASKAAVRRALIAHGFWAAAA